MAKAAAITLSTTKLIGHLNRLGYTCTKDRLNLCGLRGAEWVSKQSVRLVKNVADAYNDSIIVFGTSFRVFKASVDPGAYYTDHPLNKAGCANLKDGSYLYSKGMHRSSYSALVQASGDAGKVTVWRDKDEDHIQDKGELVQSGHYGINIHAGGSGTKVGKWSAGCQVLWGGRGRGSAWEAFMKLIDDAASKKAKNPQKQFRYFLVNGSILTDKRR